MKLLLVLILLLTGCSTVPGPHGLPTHHEPIRQPGAYLILPLIGIVGPIDGDCPAHPENPGAPACVDVR